MAQGIVIFVGGEQVHKTYLGGYEIIGQSNKICYKRAPLTVHGLDLISP